MCLYAEETGDGATYANVVQMLVVDVHERALDVRQPLQLALKILAHIVRNFQRCIGIHDDINFDVELLTSVVGAALCERLRIS